MPRKVKAVFENLEMDTNMAQRNVFEKKHRCKFVYIEK